MSRPTKYGPSHRQQTNAELGLEKGVHRPPHHLALQEHEEEKREGPPGWFYPDWLKAHPEFAIDDNP